MTNAKSTKRALVASALAILMCVAMLIGTTFAWFTDTASTGVNKIQAGNLKMEVSYKNSEKTNFTKVDENTPVLNNSALWEPGHVEYAVLNVKNVGTLALKYKLGINIANETGSTNVNGDAFKLSDYIKFAVIDGDQSALGRAALLEKATDSKLIKEGYSKESHLDTTGANETVTLVVWMPETVGNEANHAVDAAAPEINLGIDVVATQYTYEKDSFNDQYDKDAPLDFVPVSNATDLANVFTNAKAGEPVNVSLDADVEISATSLNVLNTNYPAVGDINIQGNGHTLTNNNENSVRGLQIANSTVARTVTISNVNLKLTGTDTGYNAKENRGVQLFGLENATINLVNCNIDMTATNYSYAVKVIGSKNLTINITGCTLTSANCIEVTNTSSYCTFNITDCVLNSNYKVNVQYGGLCIQDYYSKNNTYNVKNTTFNGENARYCDLSSDGSSKYNDLGGNVNNTTRTTE